MNSNLQRIFISVAIVMLQMQYVSAQSSSSEKVHLIGDVRFGYFVRETNTRTDNHESDHDFRLRTRLGIEWQLHKNIGFTARYAGRFTSDDFSFDPGLSTTSENNKGLRLGEMAFDKAYFSIQNDSKNLIAKAGRFQTNYALPGVINKSLIRLDSPNTDIQWTDGLFLSGLIQEKWQANLIAQMHLFRAPSNSFRSPLELNGSGLFVTLFGSIKRNFDHTFFNWSRLNITYTPNGLRNSSGERKSYIATSTQATGNIGNFEIATELGYSFNRPLNSDVGLNNNPNKKTGGFGVQQSFSLLDFAKNQDLGMILAYTEAAQLTSSDYAENQWTWEVRYTYRLPHDLTLEARIRQRGDIKKQVSRSSKENEFVPYIRLTYRF